VDDPTSTTDEAANEVTNDAGTATGEVNENGITIVDGITTTELECNEMIVDDTTETTTDDGTEAGTLDH